jgi:hypothetical protein
VWKDLTTNTHIRQAGQFYSASWFITHPDPTQRPPTSADVRAMLSDICINSGAEVSFEKLNFHIYGSDDAVRAALMVISNIPFVKKSQYNMSVKIELANEHKEFVSGKKNGKINKIMSHSSVQIVFDGFNEYNFYIVVRGAQYEATKNGLDLVEQEMPASVPQAHYRYWWPAYSAHHEEVFRLRQVLERNGSRRLR